MREGGEIILIYNLGGSEKNMMESDIAGIHTNTCCIEYDGHVSLTPLFSYYFCFIFIFYLIYIIYLFLSLFLFLLFLLKYDEI